MPRIRAIYPSFKHDSKVKRLSRDARLTFLLMLCEADDEGRMPGSGKWLAGTLYEDDDDVTPVKIMKWVGQMVKEGMVTAYEVDGAKYLHITKFGTYQHPKNPTRSKLPPPPGSPPTTPAPTPGPAPPPTPAAGEAASPLSIRDLEVRDRVSLSSVSDLHLVRDPSANGGEGKSQVKPQTDRWAAIVDRIVAMLGERSRPQAEALLDRWRSILAVQLIDQAIGMCEHAEKPPRSIAYFEQTLRQTAALNDVDVPAMPAESA